MTTSNSSSDLRRDEGLRLTAYPDPLSGAAPWTIGYGHTGPDVREGLSWILAQAELALTADIQRVCLELDRQLPWWRRLDDLRQDVLANMAFNLGIGRLLGFARTLAMIHDERWDAAAQAMLDSAWATQVGARARRLADQMRTGARAL